MRVGLGSKRKDTKKTLQGFSTLSNNFVSNTKVLFFDKMPILQLKVNWVVLRIEILLGHRGKQSATHIQRDVFIKPYIFSSYNQTSFRCFP